MTRATRVRKARSWSVCALCPVLIKVGNRDSGKLPSGGWAHTGLHHRGPAEEQIIMSNGFQPGEAVIWTDYRDGTPHPATIVRPGTPRRHDDEIELSVSVKLSASSGWTASRGIPRCRRTACPTRLARC